MLWCIPVFLFVFQYGVIALVDVAQRCIDLKKNSLFMKLVVISSMSILLFVKTFKAQLL